MKKTERLVLGAMMMCLIVIMTMIVKIPIPMTRGYVHLGDAMIFMSVMILGKRGSIICGGIGSALADIFSGMAMWAPWTLVIKGVMGFVMASIMGNEGHSKVRFIIGFVAAGIWMTAGYFVAEGIMYGNWAVAALGIPWNIGQFVLGGVITMALTAVLCKTNLESRFTYKLSNIH